MNKTVKICLLRAVPIFIKLIIPSNLPILAFFMLISESSIAQTLKQPQLTGIWEGSETCNVPGFLQFQSVVTVIFGQDNSYSRQHKMLSGHMTLDKGKYTLNQNMIRFQIHDFEPKVYKGVQQHTPETDSWIVESLTGNKLIAHGGDYCFIDIRLRTH